MNVSFAAIDPPFAKFGETKTTRPTTSDAILVRRSIRTEPVSSTVSDCVTGDDQDNLRVAEPAGPLPSGSGPTHLLRHLDPQFLSF